MIRLARISAKVLIIIMIVWTVLTIWVQYAGNAEEEIFDSDSGAQRALIVYNPDPIYDLDAQMCRFIAEELSIHGFTAKIVTARAAINDKQTYNLYVLCSNTYNWSPDWGIVDFIEEHSQLVGANTMLITLGSGSTKRSKRVLENKVKTKNAKILGSWEFWLMRPNDESRMDESNIQVAKDKVQLLCREALGKTID